MKNLMTLFSLVCFTGALAFSSPSKTDGSDLPKPTMETATDVVETLPADYKKRSPIYDYKEQNLNNVDTIPGYETKLEKLKISGTIFQNDGVTPAKDVILYINQTDENGNFDLKIDAHKKRYVYHSAWVKTNSDGHYTFYTFIPGTVRRSNELKHIHPVIKAPGQAEYELDAFVFDNDPLMTKRCRNKLADNMLVLDKKEEMFVATKDIILISNGSSNN